MNLPKRITIVEVGLRDGLQNECSKVDTGQKLGLLRDILEEGIMAAEIGSFVRPDVMPQMADTGVLFQAVSGWEEKAEFRALVPNYRGLELAIASGCRSVKVGVSASRVHNLRNYNRTPEQSIAAFESIFTKAREEGISLIGTLQMAFGSPWEGEIPLQDIVSVVGIYDRYKITKVGLGDTASMASPAAVYRICSQLRERFPQIRFKAHFHNARGLGLCNILAAMAAGIEEFDTAFAGLGGCPFVPEAAGNIATEDVVNLMDELGVETGVDIGKAIRLGCRAERLVGHSGSSFVLKAGTSRGLIERLTQKESV